MNTKKYVLISGLELNDNNRGTAALGFGAFSFLSEKFDLNEKAILCVKMFRNPCKIFRKNEYEEILEINDKEYKLINIYIWTIDELLLKFFGFVLPFSKYRKYKRYIEYVAAINGGDGISDIYNTLTFESRLRDMIFAKAYNIPLIFLPQTIGPFQNKRNLAIATRLLKYATKIYVRDLEFATEFEKLGISYKLEKDLSFHMKPQPVKENIQSKAVGLNISGLAYFNNFRALSGQFENYPFLIREIINYFQSLGVPIYLISHSYNYTNPEINNDDLCASKEVYNTIKNKDNVYVIGKDLKSPQIKYIISQCSFFIGTRMHANFAAIFTGTPVFGLSYSYKFAGAFDSLGLSDSYANIRNLAKTDIPKVLSNIKNSYSQVVNDI
ncbi:hypothetical protein FACS189461_1760 [Spirochaetia bacterium]|nr:hypothetical protein FACS189461_1760 [Spirochaetia bacterium]